MATKAKPKKVTVEEQIQDLVNTYSIRKLYNLYVAEQNDKQRAILREAWKIKYKEVHSEGEI